MIPFRCCNHVIEGKRPARITKLDGQTFVDCGNESHFSNIRQLGQTQLRHSSHFSTTIQEIASGLPAGCSAFLDGQNWIYESFEDSRAQSCEKQVCHTMESLSEVFSNFTNSDEYTIFENEGGDLTIMNLKGVRSIPVWNEAFIAESPNHLRPGGDIPVLLGAVALVDRLAHLPANNVHFVMMNGSTHSDRAHLVLISDFSKILVGANVSSTK